MNLNDIVDSNTTTRKMRSVLRRSDIKKEVGRLSKRKNANSDERNNQPMDGPADGQTAEVEPVATDMQLDD